jgi:hypothetical protein
MSTSGGLFGRQPARRPRLDRIGKTANQLRRARTDFGWKARENFASLGHEAVRDSCVQLLPRGSCRQEYRTLIARVARPYDVAFAFESTDDPACSAFIEIELGSKLIKRAPVATNQDVQRVALGDGNFMAADSITVAELIDTAEGHEGVVEFRRLTTEEVHSCYYQLPGALEPVKQSARAGSPTLFCRRSGRRLLLDE